MTGLLVNTTTGPVLGYGDTFSFANESKAPEVLKGVDGGHPAVAKWLGIPYAEAERWKRSVPHEPWTNPLECYDFGTTFPAPEDRNGHILFTNHGLPHRGSRLRSSETSFVTNVYAPGDYKAGEKLPVLAWIHGGGLVFGNSADMVYDPTRLIRKQAERGRRVIVVSANYRLNVLGFLSSNDLAEEAGQVTGNFGLYDCVSWLEWLKVNIEAFGGDPDNITIYGESAGSVLCNLLCLHPAPLFKRAILQSGAVSTMPPLSAADAEAVYQNLLTAHGITTETHPTAASRLSALRAIDVDTLVSSFNDFPPRASRLAIEHGLGAIYTDHPLAMIRAGKLNKGIEAILLGSMASEGNLFELIFPPPSQDFALALFPQAKDEIRQHYTSGDMSKWSSLSGSKLITDFLFNAPIDELADTLANQDVNVHRYMIQTAIEKIDKDTNLGPCHSVSLPFLFDVDVLWDGQDESVEGRSATNVSNAVCRFASGDIAEDWPLLSAEDPQQLVFTSKGAMTVEPVDVGDSDRVFWRKIYSRQRQAQGETKVTKPHPVQSNGVHVLAEGVKTR